MEHLEVGLIMTIEAKIVAIVASVSHDNIRVFLGDEKVVLLVKPQRRRLVPLVAGITVEVREIGLRADELSIRNTDRRVAGERRVHERDRRQAHRPPPGLQKKRGE